MHTYIDKVRSAESLGDIWQLLKEFANRHALTCLCYHQLDFYTKEASHKTVIVDGLNGGKDHETLAKNARVRDPINQAAAQSAEPFTWDEIQDLVYLSPSQREFMMTVFRRLDKTITVPVFGPAGRNGYFCFEVEDLPAFKEKFATFNAVQQLAHKKICSFIPAETVLEQRLTKREQDVLQLMSFGKSNTTIATILNISSHTVHTYIQRIYKNGGVRPGISGS